MLANNSATLLRWQSASNVSIGLNKSSNETILMLIELLVFIGLTAGVALVCHLFIVMAK